MTQEKGDYIPPAPPPRDEIIINPAKGPDITHCPLCLQKWTVFEEQGKNGKAWFVCHNSWCMISIWVRDPLLGKYFNYDKIPCASCGEDMRLFFRSDQYMKCYCPKCKVTVEHVDEKKHEAVVQDEIKRGIRWAKPKDKFND